MAETYYFSPSSKNFYPAALKADYDAAGTWPEDGVEVSEDTFLEFAATPNAEGKVRGVDNAGAPAWVDPPAPTAAELAAQRLNTAQAAYNTASARIDAIQQQIDDEDYNETDTDQSLITDKAEWTSYRKELRAYLKTDGSGSLPVRPK